MYNIPLFKLNFDEQEENAIIEVLRSKWISMGPKTQELEVLFAEMFGVKYAIAVSNCTVALHLSMLLNNITEGDEVICPSLTFAATVNSIRYVNATPVFCDIISPKNPTIDPEKIESLITNRTKAFVVMHYAGFPCRMDEIKKLSERHNLRIIEDACHAPLSKYKDKILGSIGDTGCFSFFSNKNISTGEGGMLVTNDEKMYSRAKLLRSHGMTSLSYERSKGHSTEYDVIDLGYNYRIDDLRAAIALVQLKKLKHDLEIRATIRKKYIALLSGVAGMDIPFSDHAGYSSNYIFPIVLKNSTRQKRDSLRAHLYEKGIQTSIHYPSVHKFAYYARFSKSLPETEYVSDCSLSLPMYSQLKTEELEYICSALINAL